MQLIPGESGHICDSNAWNTLHVFQETALFFKNLRYRQIGVAPLGKVLLKQHNSLFHKTKIDLTKLPAWNPQIEERRRVGVVPRCFLIAAVRWLWLENPLR